MAKENLQVVFDECEIHHFAADHCRTLPRVAKVPWHFFEQFGVVPMVLVSGKPCYFRLHMISF